MDDINPAGCIQGKRPGCNNFLWAKIHGFTLVELVAVLAIFGIMALLAWPVMYKSLDELYLRQTAHQLLRDIRFVQQQAMNNPSGGWKLVFINGQVVDGEYQDIQGWSVYRYENDMSRVQATRRLPTGLISLGTNFAHQEVHFSELGAPLSAGHAGLRNGQGSILYVIVAPVTGKTRLDTVPPS